MAAVVHHHQSILQGGQLNRAALESTTTSLAGTLAPATRVNIALGAYVFLPMFHSTDPVNHDIISTHVTDANDPDLGRVGMYGGILFPTTNHSYDLDYRQLTA